MKPKLFLHAGTHKTGTSAIQAFGNTNRKDLATRGLLYPRVRVRDGSFDDHHLDFCHAFSDTPKRLTADAAQTVLSEIACVASRSGNPVLISAEPIWRQTYDAGNQSWYKARDAYISRLANALAPFDVTLVLVFRRPDNFMKSLFLENSSRSGVSPTFKTYREGRKSKLAEYWKNSNLLAQHFPKVKFLIYEDLVQEGLIVPFFCHLDIDVSDLEMPGIVRKSITPAEAVLLNTLKGAACQGSKAMNTWLENPMVRPLIDDYLAQNRNCDLWESHEARIEFLGQCKPDLEQLRSAYFAERAQLFEPLDAGDTKPALSQLDKEVTAKLTALVPMLMERKLQRVKRILSMKVNMLWRAVRG